MSETNFTELAALHDKYDMASVIRRFPGQIEHALADDDLVAVRGKSFDSVILAGMGGSALGIDLLCDALGDRLRVPVTVCSHYQHRGPISASPLLIASSFSGNTEESLEAMDALEGQVAEVAVLAAGGRLGEIAAERDLARAIIPAHREGEGFQPRSSTGYGTTYLARLLMSAGVLDDCTEDFRTLVPFLKYLDVRGQAQETAAWLSGRLPVIYSDGIHERSIARIMKIKLNENGKRPALFGSIPDINHHEMIGLAGTDVPLGILYLHDPTSHPAVRERFEVMRDSFAAAGKDLVEFREWELPGDSCLQRVFAAVAFGDWCSYTSALLSGSDPTPVDLVESFKKALVAKRGG